MRLPEFLALLWTDLRWRASWVGLLAAIVTVPLLGCQFSFDQAVFTTMADAILAGDVLYRDVWELKPPGIAAVYALAFLLFGRDIWAVRLLELLAVAISAAGLVRLMEERFKTRLGGVISGLSFGFLYLSLGGNSAQPEAFQIPFVVWALVFWPGREGQLHPERRCFGVGVLISIALLFKSPILLIAMALGLDRLFMDSGAPGWKMKMRLSGCYLAGLVLPGFLVAAYYSLRGAFIPMVDAWVLFPSQYAGALVRVPLLEMLRQGVYWMLSHVPPTGVLLVALGLPAAFFAQKNSLKRWGVLTGLAWATVIFQSKGFPYHYYAMLPFVALGTGLAFSERIVGNMVGGLRLAGGALAGAMIVGFGIAAAPAWGAFRGVARFPKVEASLHNPGSAQAQEWELAAPVLALTAPGDRIYVWGNMPGVYVYSQRLPGGRYFHLMAVLPPWSKGERLSLLLDRLEVDCPKLVLIASSPQWWAKGKDSKQLLAESPDFLRYLHEHYELKHTLGTNEYWIRRS